MNSGQPQGSLEHEHILGLDIGANSIGWALVDLEEGRPRSLRAAGVRVFEAGVKGDISSGRDTSRAAARREARSRRRMIERGRRRLTKLAHILQRAGLLPSGELDAPDGLHTYFLRLDGELFPEHARKGDPHRMHYRLRARALYEKLSPHEIGRAIYHLSQRRGFRSNRKSVGKGRDDDRGKVKGGIKTVKERMKAANAQTLGEYFAGLDLEQARIRGHYLHRETMVEHEFNLIWEAQAAHYSDLLTDELRGAVHNAIFFQRDLKTPERFIGLCELERTERRAPFTDLAAQRFRLLQKVNDLRYTSPDGGRRDLTCEQRRKLAELLDTKEKMSFDDIRKNKKLKLEGARFNFETIGETGIIGNRTGARLAKAFGARRWKALTAEQRSQAVEEFISIEREEDLRQWGIRRWNLDDKAVEKLVEVRLESSHCNHSRKAIERLLPLMEKGVPYARAVEQCYPDRAEGEGRPLLPPLKDVVEVRNPAVERALTEVRKVVNAIIREYGKPDRVRIELARDLKKNRKQRQAISLDIAENQKERNEAIADLKRMGYEPSGRNTEKWLLWRECNHQCPYTGAIIGPTDLFGDPPQFQVEHIIPPHIFPDNSFLNKTLCSVEKNQQKSNQTPWQAFGGDSPEWEDIVHRVSKFQGRGTREVESGKPRRGGKKRAKPFVHPKLERFQIKTPDELDDFTRRQLTDTQYAARLAIRYVGQLYGAGTDGVDAARETRVQAGRAGVTAQLQRGWWLNSILGGGEEKKREDHRQHGIDAVCIALTTPGTVKRVSEAWERGWRTRGQGMDRMEPPWPGFLDDVRDAVSTMVVSHCVSRKVAGAMHKELPWSPRRRDAEGKDWVHQRKPLVKLSAKEVGDIVDDRVRECVQNKLRELGKSDPKQAFKSEDHHPQLRTRRGPEIPIHKVRVRKPDPTRTIGADARKREVMLESNHHVEVIKATNGRGREIWKGLVVSTYDAMQRVKEARRAGSKGNVAVQTDHGDGVEFLFSLAQGETIELVDGETGQKHLYVVEKVTKRVAGGRERHTVGIVGVNDARPSTGPDKSHVREVKELSAEVLHRQGCRKVVVTPLGEVRRASD